MTCCPFFALQCLIVVSRRRPLLDAMLAVPCHDKLGACQQALKRLCSFILELGGLACSPILRSTETAQYTVYRQWTSSASHAASHNPATASSGRISVLRPSPSNPWRWRRSFLSTGTIYESTTCPDGWFRATTVKPNTIDDIKSYPRPSRTKR